MSNTTDRRAKRRRTVRRNRLIIIAIILLVVGMYARNIVKLEYENRKLKEENKALTEQRDKLKIELKNVNSKEYIEDRARQQLRLVNPDEILFVFPGEDEDGDKSNEGQN